MRIKTLILGTIVAAWSLASSVAAAEERDLLTEWGMSISGGGLTGSMSITYGSATQAVSISTQGTGVKGVTISLSR